MRDYRSNRGFGPKPKLFRRLKCANLKKLAQREKKRFEVPKIATDDPRSAHKNMIITPIRPTYRIDPNKELKERDEKPLEELKIDQNYDVVKKKVTTLVRTGKIVIKYVRNNPPGKRYYPLSEAKIAKGDNVGDYGIVKGTTFSEYSNKVKARKKEDEESSWRK
jgi:hypothetical protein